MGNLFYSVGTIGHNDALKCPEEMYRLTFLSGFGETASVAVSLATDLLNVYPEPRAM